MLVGDINLRQSTVEAVTKRLITMLAKLCAQTALVKRQSTLAQWPLFELAEDLYKHAQGVHGAHVIAVEDGTATRKGRHSDDAADLLKMRLLKAELEESLLATVCEQRRLQTTAAAAAAPLPATAALLGASKKAATDEARLGKMRDTVEKLRKQVHDRQLVALPLDATVQDVGSASLAPVLEMVKTERARLVPRLPRGRGRFGKTVALADVNVHLGLVQPLTGAVRKFNVVLEALRAGGGQLPPTLTVQAVLANNKWDDPYRGTRVDGEPEPEAADGSANLLSAASIAAATAVYTCQRVREEIVALQRELYALGAVQLGRLLKLCAEATELLDAVSHGRVRRAVPLISCLAFRAHKCVVWYVLFPSLLPRAGCRAAPRARGEPCRCSWRSDRVAL